MRDCDISDRYWIYTELILHRHLLRSKLVFPNFSVTWRGVWGKGEILCVEVSLTE